MLFNDIFGDVSVHDIRAPSVPIFPINFYIFTPSYKFLYFGKIPIYSYIFDKNVKINLNTLPVCVGWPLIWTMVEFHKISN